MPRWFDSLQFRMIIGFTAVLALALAGVSVYVGMAAQKEVERYESQMDSVETNRAQMVVSNYYSDRKDWSGLQPLVERIWPVWNQRLIIYNEHGKIVADSHASFVGVSQRIVRRGGAPAEQTPASPVPVLVDNRQVGALSMDDDMDGDMESPDLAGPAAGSVLSAVNRSLVWTGIAAAVLGTLLIALLSGRVLSPVQSLGAAALRLGRGDLTQRAPASGSAEIKQLAASFNAMAANLEEAERYRRDLAADVAHELRTPVSNIQGYLEAIKDGLLEPSGETIDVIYSQVTHLSRLVEDLRLLAQVESGALRLDRLPSPVPDLLQRCLDAARPRAEASGVQIKPGNRSSNPPRRNGRHPDRPGRGQPLGQRYHPHAGKRKRKHRRRPDRRRPGRSLGERHRQRHPGGRPAEAVRPLLPRRPVALPEHRRRGLGLDHRQAVGRSPRRNNRGRKRPRFGQHVLLPAAGNCAGTTGLTPAATEY